MNKFINRELASLNRVYQEPEGGLLVLYGRRRLGKTSLLREFARDKLCVYYMADQAAELSQRNSMARVMADALNEPLMEQMQYAEWYDLFAAFDRLRPADQKQFSLLMSISTFAKRSQLSLPSSNERREWLWKMSSRSRDV